MARAAIPLLLVPALACAEPRPSADVPPREATADEPMRAPVDAVDDARAPAPQTTNPAGPRPCGPLDCLQFDTVEAAFARVMAENPLALGVGEAHAQKGSEAIASATKRFGDTLLPTLADRASDLVVELMLPPRGCGETKEKVVEQVEKPVTERQRGDNKNEFVALGHRAKELGIQPWALEPTCSELEAVTGGGVEAVDRMLTLIADLTAKRVAAQLQRSPETMVVAYGGALHNDLAPAAERAPWSFGPRLSQLTNGRYVELDLIVPELIRDSDSWRRLPWYPHYDRERLGGKTTLFRVAPRSYVLVFPVTR